MIEWLHLRKLVFDESVMLVCSYIIASTDFKCNLRPSRPSPSLSTKPKSRSRRTPNSTKIPKILGQRSTQSLVPKVRHRIYRRCPQRNHPTEGVDRRQQQAVHPVRIAPKRVARGRREVARGSRRETEGTASKVIGDMPDSRGALQSVFRRNHSAGDD